MGSSHVNDQLPSFSLLDCTSLAPQATSNKLEPTTTEDQRMALSMPDGGQAFYPLWVGPKRPALAAGNRYIFTGNRALERYSNIAVLLRAASIHRRQAFGPSRH